MRPLDRGDTCLLMLAADIDGTAVAACGLADLRTERGPVVPADHPLLGEPGIPERTGFFHPEGNDELWVGVPVGARWPTGSVELASGWRN